MAQSPGFTLWLTGMSGTGKSTLANYIAARLRQVGRPVEVLDEGEQEEALWAGLGETKEERNAIVRRLGHVAGLLSRNGVATLVAAVSPYKSSRDENRRSVHRYLEVYVDCPTETLIARDTTGRYKRALGGEIPNFIGITEPYEPPNSAEVIIHSDTEAVEEGGLRIFQSLLDLGYVTPDELKIITGKKMVAQPPTLEKVEKKAPKPKVVVAEKAAKAKPAAPEKASKPKVAAVKAPVAKKAAAARPAPKPAKAVSKASSKSSKPAAKASAPTKGAKARPVSRAARVSKPAPAKAAPKKAAAAKRKSR